MKRLLCLLIICGLLSGCTGETKAQETHFVMDTVMDLQLWGADAHTGCDRIKTMLNELEQDWSATNEASVLSLLNRGEEVLLDEQQKALLEGVEQLSERTGGAFDPTMGAVSRVWGFYDQQYRVPMELEISTAMSQELWDLGAALKGYAGDRAVEIMKQLDIDRAVLNFGGNVQTYGSKPGGERWQIGIQNPDGSGSLGIISVEGTMSIVTSGDYQRYFEQGGVRYHHILDPETGYPAASGLRSVTVICRDGLTADALSTALFVMGLEQATAFWRQSADFEAVFVLRSGQVYATEGASLSGCEFEVISREK